MSTPMKFSWSGRLLMVKDPIAEAVKAGDMTKAKRLQNHAAAPLQNVGQAIAPPKTEYDTNLDILKAVGFEKSPTAMAWFGPLGAIGDAVLHKTKPLELMKWIIDVKQSTDAISSAQGNVPLDGWNNYDKLKMRLGLDKTAVFGVDYCNIFETTSKVFVFVVANQCADVLEDEKGSFPSDKLVAKFHLIRSSK